MSTLVAELLASFNSGYGREHTSLAELALLPQSTVSTWPEAPFGKDASGHPPKREQLSTLPAVSVVAAEPLAMEAAPADLAPSVSMATAPTAGQPGSHTRMPQAGHGRRPSLSALG